MTVNETDELSSARIDASCRVPLLALCGGAAVCLVVGLVLEIIASLTFHNPELFACCSFLTYGHVFTAANDLLVYGFAVPAALGVTLWVLARLSQAELVLPLVPVVAANIWFVGVFIGLVAILVGESSGYGWLEFPRAAAVLLFAAFLLIAVSAVATFGQRKERELYPSHWFLLAALLWFPWIYSSANLFLLSGHPVRGVGQAVIDWWFTNNFIFVWFALVGLGIAFYLLPKFAGRPLQSRFYAQFAFWTLIVFGAWCGIPQGAPVPAWLPAFSAVSSGLLIIPLIAIFVIFARTVCGAHGNCQGGPFCYVKFGTAAFLLSLLMLIALGCPHMSLLTENSWFNVAQVQWQIFGFLAPIVIGAIYESLPGIMGFALPFPKFVRVQHWCFIIGNAILLISLAVGGIEQAAHNYQLVAALPFLRVSTVGWALLLVGSLLFTANIFVMTFKWKMGLLKSGFNAVTAPLTTPEVKS
jgi:cytochrome c oxidase cbb3-type subunit 1